MTCITVLESPIQGTLIASERAEGLKEGVCRRTHNTAFWCKIRPRSQLHGFMSHKIRKADTLGVKLAAANREQRIQELRFVTSNETSFFPAADPLLKCSTLGRRSPDCLFICRRFQMEQDLSQLRATVVLVPADHPSARRRSWSHGCAKRAKSTRRQMNE